MLKEIIKTADGSNSFFVPELNEHYHSENGALTESRKIFIEYGFEAAISKDPSLKILEVGFGTGLNALLTYYAGRKAGKKVQYVGIDPYLPDPAQMATFNYHEFIEHVGVHDVFMQMHNVADTLPFFISDIFVLNKLPHKLEDVQLQQEQFNLIYFDAFSPEAQPEMWNQDVFQKLFNCLAQNGVLTTYSAKGQVKRNLKESGFEVENLPGPPGKREVTRAWKR